MIDFHNHILPNVDDGPKTIEESLEMLKYASKQGITKVINTVHYQHPKMDNKNVEFNYLNDILNNLQANLYSLNIDIKLYLATEVFYLPNLVDILNDSITTFGNKKFMLIEFSTLLYHKSFEEEIYKLQNKGVIPIIAHPERYKFVQNDLSILKKWIEHDYILQIDAGSILGQFGDRIKKLSFNIMENFGFHLIGSDAHNTKKRNFCLKDSYDLINKKYEKVYVEKLKNNSESILIGEIPDIIVTEQNSSLLNIIKGKFK